MKICWYAPLGTGITPFDDGTPETIGCGGAEASVVFLTRELAKLGHEIKVYNEPPKSGKTNRVFYDNAINFDPTEHFDVFILHRTPPYTGLLNRINADLKVFFSCDQCTVGNWSSEIYPFVDMIICISEYHKRYVKLYKYAPDKKIWITDLGVNIEDYQRNIMLMLKVLYTL